MTLVLSGTLALAVATATMAYCAWRYLRAEAECRALIERLNSDPWANTRPPRRTRRDVA